MHAAEVQRLPVHNVQGAMTAGATWHLSEHAVRRMLYGVPATG